MTDTQQTPEEPTPVDEALVEHLCKTSTKAELARGFLRLEQRLDVAMVGERFLGREEEAHAETRALANRLRSRVDTLEAQLNGIGTVTLHRPHGSAWTAAAVTPFDAYEVRVSTGELLRLVAAENRLADALAELARHRADSLATLNLDDDESAS